MLGGGVVPGSLVLIGGEPGIGKSTLLLQAAAHLRTPIGPVLYSSGEESEHQIKSRGERLGGREAARRSTSSPRPASSGSSRRSRASGRHSSSSTPIQTIFSLKFQSAPGSIGQVREAATQLLFAAKGQNIPTFLVGHVTKDGNLAGPKALEHIVDTVLYFEGEKHHSHRVVRAVKNRFGAVSELGVFEMTGDGSARGAESVGAVPGRAARRTRRARRCCAASKGRGRCWSKCRRSSARSSYGNARRMASGIDQNRLSLLLAVLEKRAGLNLLGEDVFVNVAGGMTVDEPAADLGVVAAVASSLRNRPIKPGTAVFGEVGLAGEVPRTSPARPTSPNTAVRADRAVAQARRDGGDHGEVRRRLVDLMPPATLTKTSSPTRFSPARFSSTARSSDRRFWSMPLAIRRALPYELVLTSACTSTSSGREPSTQHSTAEPGAFGGPLGQEQLPTDSAPPAARAGHLEHAELADRAEAVLDRADDAVRVMLLALEVEDRVDDVLERLGPGEAAVLGDVADEERRDVLPLGREQQLRRRLAHLADAARRGLELQREHRLDRSRR